MAENGKGEIGFYIDRTYKVVRQDLLNQFKAEGIDLTPEQWVVLSRLEEKKKLSQSELGNQTFKDKHTLSRIVDLLCRKKYVKRKVASDDKRKIIVKLTSKGEGIISSAKPTVLKNRERGWSNLSQEEYAQLIQTLDKILESYNG